MNVTREQLAEMIRATNGRIFVVNFDKRTGEKENRTMNARLGVKKYLKGGKASYDFREKGLIPCFDLSKMAYRAISTESIHWATVDGVTYEVEQ